MLQNCLGKQRNMICDQNLRQGYFVFGVGSIPASLILFLLQVCNFKIYISKHGPKMVVCYSLCISACFATVCVATPRLYMSCGFSCICSEYREIRQLHLPFVDIK